MELLNPILLIALIAWLVSQVTKTVIHRIIHHELKWDRMVGDGGMPSSHTAIAVSATVAVGLRVGWNSPLFAVAVVFTLIVMHDAMGVRQETGKQARVINNILEIFESQGDDQLTPEEQLKEFVGHTKRQVFVGAAVGAAVALLVNPLLG